MGERLRGDQGGGELWGDFQRHCSPFIVNNKATGVGLRREYDTNGDVASRAERRAAASMAPDPRGEHHGV